MVRRPTHKSIGLRVLRLEMRAWDSRPYGWLVLNQGPIHESIGIPMVRLEMRAWDSRPYGWLRELKQTVAIGTLLGRTGMPCSSAVCEQKFDGDY